MTTSAWPALTSVSACTTVERVGTSVSIGTVSGDQKRVLYWLVVPVVAGQVLRVQGRARVTNDVAAARRYTTGFGYWLDSYDYNDGAEYADKVWTRIGPLYGDNVTADRHHMPCDIFDDYEIPAAWPSGHRMKVAMRGDAASSSVDRQDGDVLTVDDYGRLSVWVYQRA
jgi:hypothetical protein